MRQNSDEIYDGNEGENEKADDDNSEEDHDGITMKCDFDLNCGGSDVEQLVMLSEKTVRNYLMKRMTNKNFMDFKTCIRNSLYHLEFILSWK